MQLLDSYLISERIGNHLIGEIAINYFPIVFFSGIEASKKLMVQRPEVESIARAQSVANQPQYLSFEFFVQFCSQF